MYFGIETHELLESVKIVMNFSGALSPMVNAVWIAMSSTVFIDKFSFSLIEIPSFDLLLNMPIRVPA